MMKANTVDTPTNSNRAGDQMTQRAGNIAANAHRPESFADNKPCAIAVPGIN